jgi:hypothetical protein
MQIRSLAVFLFALAAGMTLSACGTSPTSATTVSSVTVSGGIPGVGASSQFSAVATLPSGATQDVTTSATWTTSNTGVATVSTTGLVIGVSAGAVVISATYSGVSGADSVTIP